MRATMAEQIAINAKLQEVCKSTEGICLFSEGWNDKRVAAEVAPRLTENHVAYVRKQMGFGVLRTITKNDAKDIEELQAFIVQLVQGFERLTQQYTGLAARVKALEGAEVIPLEARRL